MFLFGFTLQVARIQGQASSSSQSLAWQNKLIVEMGIAGQLSFLLPLPPSLYSRPSLLAIHTADLFAGPAI